MFANLRLEDPLAPLSYNNNRRLIRSTPNHSVTPKFLQQLLTILNTKAINSTYFLSGHILMKGFSSLVRPNSTGVSESNFDPKFFQIVYLFCAF